MQAYRFLLLFSPLGFKKGRGWALEETVTVIRLKPVPTACFHPDTSNLQPASTTLVKQKWDIWGLFFCFFGNLPHYILNGLFGKTWELVFVFVFMVFYLKTSQKWRRNRFPYTRSLGESKQIWRRGANYKKKVCSLSWQTMVGAGAEEYQAFRGYICAGCLLRRHPSLGKMFQ